MDVHQCQNLITLHSTCRAGAGCSHRHQSQRYEVCAGMEHTLMFRIDSSSSIGNICIDNFVHASIKTVPGAVQELLARWQGNMCRAGHRMCHRICAHHRQHCTSQQPAAHLGRFPSNHPPLLHPGQDTALQPACPILVL